MPTETKPDQPSKGPIPPWAWIFAVACGIIPVLTLGGAIPGAIGIGCAAGCIGVARNAAMPLGARLGICVATTVAAWVGVIMLLGGLALFSQ
jgi:hypothetical protein